MSGKSKYRPKSNGDKGKYLDYVTRAGVKAEAVGSNVVQVQLGGNRKPFDMFNPPNVIDIWEVNANIKPKPEGCKFCINCGDWVKVDKFSEDKRNKDGLRSWCKACRNEQERKHYWLRKMELLEGKMPRAA